MKISILLRSAVISVMCLGSPAYAIETIKLTIGAGHPPTIAAVEQAIATLIPEIDRILAEGGNYEIEWTTAWAGTIAKPTEVLEAVESGILDVGVVPALFESAKLPLESITYIAPFGANDLDMITKVVNDLHQKLPAFRQAWLDNNQQYLASAGLDTYHIITNFPLNSLADLEGKKIGTGGAAANWLSGTGASAVSGNLTKYYNDIKNGVYDGAMLYGSSVAPFKLYEVAPYYTEVGFGAMMANAISVNSDRWEDLPEEVQNALQSAATTWSKAVTDATEERLRKNRAAMIEGGGIVSVFPAEERAKWAAGMTNVAKQWASDLEAKGVPAQEILSSFISGLRDAGASPVRDWSSE